MRLTMQRRQAVEAKAAARYQRSRKKEKSLILDELVELTDYNRVFARLALRQHGRRWCLTGFLQSEFPPAQTGYQYVPSERAGRSSARP
jgi:hypothetical protein